MINKLKNISIFILFIILFILSAVGLIGLSYQYGQADIIVNMVSQECMCNKLNITDLYVEHYNNTCLLGNGTNSYKIGSFIIRSNEVMKFKDKLYILIYFGKYPKVV